MKSLIEELTSVFLKWVRQPPRPVILADSDANLGVATIIIWYVVVIAVLLVHPLPHPLDRLVPLALLPGALPRVGEPPGKEQVSPTWPRKREKRRTRGTNNKEF